MTIDYRDLDRQPVRGDVDVRIGFPTYMGGDPAEREKSERERAVIIEVTDGPSRNRIIELALSAEQFTEILRGGTAHVSGAWLPTEIGLSRIGKTRENASTAVPGRLGVDVDVEAGKVAAQYKADGWDTVDIRKTNSGRQVVAYRYV